MMNRDQAMAYGRKIGCRFYVKNDRGGLYGGFTTRAAAEKARRYYEQEERQNPFEKGSNIRVYIEDV